MARTITDKQRGQRYQWAAIQYLGGKCEMCDLKATEGNMIVFDFHHIKAEDKEYSVSKLISTGYSWEKINNEVKKCMLFCACCHRLHHQEHGGYEPKGNK